MTDRQYFDAVRNLSENERKSLMVSEVERRRSFAVDCQMENIAKANEWAKEGFYFTGVDDKVQCAFCDGMVRTWKRDVVPRTMHKTYFDFCNTLQSK